MMTLRWCSQSAVWPTDPAYSRNPKPPALAGGAFTGCARHEPGEAGPCQSGWDEDKGKRKQTGKKARGRKLKAPESGPKDSDQVNLTDEESRIMPVSGGGFEQAYNAQASVDMDSMLVVGMHVSQAPNDKLKIVPAVEGLRSLPKSLGQVETLVTDTGYFSEKNVQLCHEKEILPLIASKRESHHPSLLERFVTRRDMPPPDPDDAVACMRYELQGKEGRSIYAKRKCTVEPVFGIIKHCARIPAIFHARAEKGTR
jgi:hypothetical protein